MGFINTIHTIIRKSNKDILNFYVRENKLLLMYYKSKSGWNTPEIILENAEDYQIDIKIDDKDKIYGITALTETGEVIYIFSNNNGGIKTKKLFSYDIERYYLLYPYIKKLESSLHIIYFLQNLKDNRTCYLLHHYFDGERWHEKCIDFIPYSQFVTPFKVSTSKNILTIFYFNTKNGIKEIYVSQFNPSKNDWSRPIQITNTKNKKLYFNLLQWNNGLFHISWSELTNENFIIKYNNCILNEDNFHISETINLSQPSNCSYPTFVMTRNALWCMWVQLDKVYACYSNDNGKTWSQPVIDSRSYENDFLIYNFSSNYKRDLNNFKLNSVFGIYYPRISFIGFKNI